MEQLLENVFLRVFFVMKLSMIYVVLLVAGLFIFGMTPANATILHLYRMYRMDVSQYSFSQAWQYYKLNFFKTNLVGLVLGSICGVLMYGLYLLVQLPKQSMLTILLSMMNVFIIFYMLCIYAIYLKLQIYYDFPTVIAIKLSAIAVFFDIKAIAKLLVGMAICAFILSRVSLIVAVFVPSIALMFLFDVLEPIYQQVARHYQTK